MLSVSCRPRRREYIIYMHVRCRTVLSLAFFFCLIGWSLSHETTTYIREQVNNQTQASYHFITEPGKQKHTPAPVWLGCLVSLL